MRSDKRNPTCSSTLHQTTPNYVIDKFWREIFPITQGLRDVYFRQSECAGGMISQPTTENKHNIQFLRLKGVIFDPCLIRAPEPKVIVIQLLFLIDYAVRFGVSSSFQNVLICPGEILGERTYGLSLMIASNKT